MGIYEDRQIHTKTGFRPIKLQESRSGPHTNRTPSNKYKYCRSNQNSVPKADDPPIQYLECLARHKMVKMSLFRDLQVKNWRPTPFLCQIVSSSLLCICICIYNCFLFNLSKRFRFPLVISPHKTSVQYCGGCSVHWRLFSTSGDNISTVGDSFSTVEVVQHSGG